MRFYKNIVGIIMVMLMTISLCINNVPADDSAASDKGGSVTSDNSGDAGDTAPVFEPKIMVGICIIFQRKQYMPATLQQ